MKILRKNIFIHFYKTVKMHEISLLRASWKIWTVVVWKHWVVLFVSVEFALLLKFIDLFLRVNVLFAFVLLSALATFQINIKFVDILFHKPILLERAFHFVAWSSWRSVSKTTSWSFLSLESFLTSFSTLHSLTAHLF